MHEKINGMAVIGNVTVDGVKYYVDIKKNIYFMQNDEYVKVEDRETLLRILEYITPKSLDVRER